MADLKPKFYCPTCGAPEFSREKRPNGYSTCMNYHKYPSVSALSHPTPVQADHCEDALNMVQAEQSLEVVAWQYKDTAAFIRDEHIEECRKDGESWKPLTDHAKATAALAKKDAEIAELKLEIAVSGKLQRERLATLRAQLSDTTGQVGKLREALEFVSSCDLASQDSGNRGLALYEAGNVARAALNSRAQESEDKAPRFAVDGSGCAAGVELCPCAEAIADDAARYRYLRERDLGAIDQGGIFAGMTPDNVILNGDDLDAAIDAALSSQQEGEKACTT